MPRFNPSDPKRLRPKFLPDLFVEWRPRLHVWDLVYVTQYRNPKGGGLIHWTLRRSDFLDIAAVVHRLQENPDDFQRLLTEYRHSQCYPTGASV